MYRRFYRTFVEYTSVRHPEIKRKNNLNRLSVKDIEYFESLLGKSRVLTQDVSSYNIDWNKSVRGQSECVLRPKTTEEVSLIMKRCHERSLGVVPQGGNTGLVGGSNPVFDEIILSTEAMNSILDVDVYSSVATVQSGVILEKLDSHLKEKGLMVPLDLGSKGSCQVGGNASTNAGGLRFLRYGSLRGNILGLEVVLPTGEILDCLSTMKKDNTGYDLKQLFLGSEGTLGIITKVSLQCPARPKAVNVALLACSNFQDVLDTFVAARSNLSEILSSFEFMDNESMNAVTQLLRLTSPIGTEDSFYVLIEVSGSNADHNDEKLDTFLNSLPKIRNGILATSLTQMKSIWELRERITESLLHDGYVYKYDISLPLVQFY
ncbi:D2HGDH [Lepeophtheirus salmonis]|uniref:D-2-hydroxyglutarate dehydrogenase, mitochondrial n=2 Tax=Lepeophtheirus salmonis TaxID=72036 RepID=A0A7R8D0I4_LEPSM|nr:D2HGDH [Lepeophtheirus salmonis]CAF2983057.1 D2HGDH [Lepeophtheirus salmonis]